MHEIRAEIPANVWQVLVDEGQLVAEGEDIVILESMKMEIPVSSPEPGVVKELLFAEGETVSEGAVIVRLDV